MSEPAVSSSPSRGDSSFALARRRAHMVQGVVRTQVDSAPEEVARIVSKYDLLSVPVVDLQNRLVGVVTVR